MANIHDKNMIIVDIKRFYFLVRRQRRRYRIFKKIMIESDVSRGSDDEFDDVINDEFG